MSNLPNTGSQVNYHTYYCLLYPALFKGKWSSLSASTWRCNWLVSNLNPLRRYNQRWHLLESCLSNNLVILQKWFFLSWRFCHEDRFRKTVESERITSLCEVSTCVPKVWNLCYIHKASDEFSAGWKISLDSLIISIFSLRSNGNLNG